MRFLFSRSFNRPGVASRNLEISDAGILELEGGGAVQPGGNDHMAALFDCHRLRSSAESTNGKNLGSARSS